MKNNENWVEKIASELDPDGFSRREYLDTFGNLTKAGRGRQMELGKKLNELVSAGEVHFDRESRLYAVRRSY